MESLGQDVGMAKATRLGTSLRTHAFRHNAKKRLGGVRDQLHDPLLTVLTVLLLLLLFVIVPLHASGIISAQGYGTLLVLLLASAVLVQSRTLLVIMVLLTAIGLAAAAAVFRFKLASSLHLYLEAGACLTIGLLLIFVIARAVLRSGARHLPSCQRRRLALSDDRLDVCGPLHIRRFAHAARIFRPFSRR